MTSHVSLVSPPAAASGAADSAAAAEDAARGKRQVVIKVVLVGDSGVGKSQLVARFVDGQYHGHGGAGEGAAGASAPASAGAAAAAAAPASSSKATVSVDLKVQVVRVRQQSVKLQIWDTAGQERYRSLAPVFFRGASCVLVCFDLSDAHSLRRVDEWIDATRLRVVDDATLLLVGLKSDAVAVTADATHPTPRVLTVADGHRLAREKGLAGYYECSALTGAHVAEPFFHAAAASLALRAATARAARDRADYAKAVSLHRAYEAEGLKYAGAACCGGGYAAAPPPPLPPPPASVRPVGASVRPVGAAVQPVSAAAAVATVSNAAGDGLSDGDGGGGPPAIDAVFADMEQGLESTGACVAACVPACDCAEQLVAGRCERCPHWFLWYQECVCCSCRVAGVALTYAFAAAMVVVVFLPAFFALLLVRTTHVEHDTAEVTVRNDVREQETRCQRVMRNMAFAVKACIPSFVFFVWPLVLTLHLLPSHRDDAYTVNGLLGLQIAIVLLFQVLGTVRAAVSWWTATHQHHRDRSAALLPDRKHTSEADAAAVTSVPAKTKKKKVQSFQWLSGSGVVACATLLLEFGQMATFGLQRISTASADPASSSASAPSASSGTDWAPKVFQALFLTIVEEQARIVLWVCVGVVVFLVAVVFVWLFVTELRAYDLTRNSGAKDKQKATTEFFYGFVGSVIYGHGNPKRVHPNVKRVVSVLTDALFLFVCLRLLQSLSCDTGAVSVDGQPRLVVDPRLVCWEGEHAVLSTLALLSFCYYVPLSVMVAPMFMTPDANADDDGDGDDADRTADTAGAGAELDSLASVSDRGKNQALLSSSQQQPLSVVDRLAADVHATLATGTGEPAPPRLTYAKLYVMTQTCIKCAMLVVSVFATARASTQGGAWADVAAAFVSSTLMLFVSVLWMTYVWRTTGAAAVAPAPADATAIAVGSAGSAAAAAGGPVASGYAGRGALQTTAQLLTRARLRQTLQPCAVSFVNFAKVMSFGAGAWGAFCGALLLSVSDRHRAALMNAVLPVGLVVGTAATYLWYRTHVRRARDAFATAVRDAGGIELQPPSALHPTDHDRGDAKTEHPHTSPLSGASPSQATSVRTVDAIDIKHSADEPASTSTAKAYRRSRYRVGGGNGMGVPCVAAAAPSYQPGVSTGGGAGGCEWCTTAFPELHADASARVPAVSIADVVIAARAWAREQPPKVAFDDAEMGAAFGVSNAASTAGGPVSVRIGDNVFVRNS